MVTNVIPTRNVIMDTAVVQAGNVQIVRICVHLTLIVVTVNTAAEHCQIMTEVVILTALASCVRKTVNVAVRMNAVICMVVYVHQIALISYRPGLSA